MKLEDLLKRNDIPKKMKSLLGEVIENQKEQNKKVEELLKEKELTDKTIDSLLDTYFIFNVEDGKPLKWNKAFNEVSGYTDEEIQFMNPSEFYPEEDQQNMREATQEVLTKGHGILRASLITKKGDLIPYEYMGVLLKNYKGNPNCICAIGRDLSERREAEKALQESKEKLSWLAEASYDYLMMLDLDLNVQFINRAEEGLTKNDILGKPLYNFVEEHHQSYVKSSLNQAIKEKKPIHYYTEYSRPDEAIIYFESIASPIIRDNQVIGLTVTSRDITKRKKAEKSADFLHTVLRHDLRNKIQVIRGFLSLVKQSDIAEKEKEHITIALNATIEAGALIDKIDTLKETDHAILEKLKQISLIPVINDVITEYKAQIIKLGVKIILNTSDKEYTIWGGTLVREIFSNLIENALIHSQGNLIEISVAELNNQIIVSVEDNGVGIHEKLKEVLFERGVKGETSKGSGLGLYLVKTIIEAYNGSINVDGSNLGGIKFNLSFNKV